MVSQVSACSFDDRNNRRIARIHRNVFPDNK